MAGNKPRLGRGIEALIGESSGRERAGAGYSGREHRAAWEYAWIDVGRKRLRLTLASDSGRRRPKLRANELDVALVGMGLQGWELVAVRQRRFYFKRPCWAPLLNSRAAEVDAAK